MKHTFVLRVVPLWLAAALLGLALTACGGGGGGNSDLTASIVERLLTSGQAQGSKVHTYVGELPAGLPWEIPSYPGSKVLASFAVEQPTQTTYFMMLDSSDSPDQILQYYEDAFDQSPWQVQGVMSSDEAMALQFNKSDDANVTGGVGIDSLPEGGNNIVVSIQTTATTGTPSAEPFKLGASRPLPASFPSDVQIYPGSTIADTTWVRSTSGLDFLITLLTKDPQKNVADFYRQDFTGRGFTVTDEPSSGSDLAQSLSFADSAGQLQGTVVADIFQQDSSYTSIKVQVHVGSGQQPGGSSPQSSSPSPQPGN